MKKLILSSVILLFVYFVEIKGQVINDWHWSHPKPVGRNLNWCHMFDSHTYYMVGWGGNFLKTTNGGLNWFESTPFIRYTGYAVYCEDAHFFNINTGIVCGGYGLIMRTTDAGITWDSVSPSVSSNPATTTYRDLYFINNNTGFVCGPETMDIAKTTNGGLTWSKIDGSIQGVSKYSVYAWDENKIIVTSYSNPAYVFKTSNGGINWTSYATGGSYLFKINFMNDNTGFVCGNSGDIKLTTNAGINWTSINHGTYSYYDIDFKNNTVYITGSPYYIYKSSNLGSSWDTVGFIQHGIQTVSMDDGYYSTSLGGGDTLLTVGKDGLINKRNSISNRLYLQKDKLTTEGCFGIGAYYETIIVAAIDGHLLYSTNGGANWNFNVLGSSHLRSVSMIDNYIAYVSGSSGKIFKTTTSGVYWTEVANITGGSYFEKIVMLDNYTGWVFGRPHGRIYKTTNGWSSWINQTPSGSGSSIYSASFINSNTGWFCGESGRVYKTTNGGSSWNTQNTNTGQTLREIDMIDENTGYFCGDDKTLRKTTDGGVTWNSLDLPIAHVFDIMSLDFIDKNNGMIVGESGRTFRTKDGGQTWIFENTGGHRLDCIVMKSLDSGFCCGAFGYVFKYVETPTGMSNYNHEVPLSYDLYQNYPNPFNPVSRIKFQIAELSEVKLVVYDVLGREVEILVNKQLSPGTFEATFDGSGFSSGVYFYKLVAGDFISVKKMVLIK